jgi:hypothetical protein
MQNERRQAERVVAVEMREEDDVYRARVHSNAAHVRQKWGAAIQQQAAIDDDRPVIAVGRKGSARTEKREG